MTELDDLDSLAADVFDGYLVKKDLAQQFRGQYPVPTYVGEFLLGRYCATTDPDEIAAGLEMVQRSMQERTVRAGEEELFKHRARDKGRVKIIDLLRARLDAKSDAYKAELPSLQLNDIHISAELVNEHQRMLTGGFYAEVTLEYIAALAERAGRPAVPRRGDPPDPDVHARRARHVRRGPLAVHARRSGASCCCAASGSSRAGSPRASRTSCSLGWSRSSCATTTPSSSARAAPASRTCSSRSRPYAHLVSGGKATIANMFVNMNTGRRGLVAQYDVICFDEVSGVSFDQKEGVNILKGYMESGEFSRGRESIRAEGGIVMVGNFDVDVGTSCASATCSSPLPKEMRDDTAFMDRIHAYIPGWDVPKLDPSYFTDHFGFVSDFLAEVWSQLRRTSRLDVLQGRLEWGAQLSGRDRKAANNTVDGLLRLLYPDPEMEVPGRVPGVGGDARARDAAPGEGGAGVHRRRRVRQGRPVVQHRRRPGDGRLLRRVGEAPACGSTSEAEPPARQRPTARCCPRPTREDVSSHDASAATTPSATRSVAASRSRRSSAAAASRRSTGSATSSRARSGRSSSSTTPRATTRCGARSARCARSTTRTSSR